jgi:Trk K+ transport system NAD-binding subunit
MMHVVFAGHDDDGLRTHLEDEGGDVATVEDIATRPALEEAGIVDADLFVLTDVDQATAVPIAKDLNEDLEVVIYSRDSLPEFASAQVDLAVDPDLLGPDAVAEELSGNGN